MATKWKYLLAFLVLALVQLGVIFSERSQFEEVLNNGITYQSPAIIAGTRDDYVHIRLRENIDPFVAEPLSQAKWLGENLPEDQETIYVAVAHDKNGMLMVKGADLKKPVQGDYIKTIAWGVDNGVVSFPIPFMRFYLPGYQLQDLPWDEFMALDPLTPEQVEQKEAELARAEPSPETADMRAEIARHKAAGEPISMPRHQIIAEFKLADGHGVITEVYVDGHPLSGWYQTSAAPATVEITPTTEGAKKA